MTVLHIISGNSQAGAERHVLLLAKTQRERGIEAHIAFRHGGWLEQRLVAGDVPHTAVGLRGTVDLLSTIQLAKLARSIDADIIHGHLARGMFYARSAGLLAGRPFVGTDHLSNPNRAMLRLQRVITVSADGKRRAIEAGCDPARVDFVLNGVDISRIQSEAEDVAAERAGWGIPVGAPVIGLLGRVVPVKGHDTLIRAVAATRWSHDPWLVFAGPQDAAWTAGLKTLASELGIADRIKFLGGRAEVGAFLAACDVVTAPSRMEALPMAVEEAMALGCAVVGSDVGGIPNIISPDRTGLLVPPEDPIRLGEAIQRLLCDADLRRRLGSAARTDALARFTPQAMEAGTRAVYEKAIRAKGA